MTFGLNDAIESGLVKTPRVVVRDDGKLDAKYRSRFYHIYSDADVKTDLNRKVGPEVPLPGLVVDGYYFLGKDWLEAAKRWKKEKQPTPPVMITVANSDAYGGTRGILLSRTSESISTSFATLNESSTSTQRFWNKPKRRTSRSSLG